MQTYTAIYYVLADLLMLSLYFHYKFKKRPSLCEYGVPLSAALGTAGERAAWEEVGFSLLSDEPSDKLR